MKTAIYPGSFDPITNGHIDVISRALAIFDRVVVGVIHNPSKAPLFELNERMAMIQELFVHEPRLSVNTFNGLLIDFAKEQNVFNIIRGLRAVSDFDYEFQMAITNRHLSPQLDTIFLMTDVTYSYLSSSLVKQVAKYGGDVSTFVPLLVESHLKDKLNE